MSSNESKKLNKVGNNGCAEYVEIKKPPEFTFALKAKKWEISSTQISKKERLDKRLSKLITSRSNQKIFVFFTEFDFSCVISPEYSAPKSQKRSLSSTLALILVNMYCP